MLSTKNPSAAGAEIRDNNAIGSCLKHHITCEHPELADLTYRSVTGEPTSRIMDNFWMTELFKVYLVLLTLLHWSLKHLADM